MIFSLAVAGFARGIPIGGNSLVPFMRLKKAADSKELSGQIPMIVIVITIVIAVGLLAWDITRRLRDR